MGSSVSKDEEQSSLLVLHSSSPVTDCSPKLLISSPRKNMDLPKDEVQAKCTTISDEYSSLEQVTDALRRAGLESSNLIIGVDFTKSNEWTGKESFGSKSLHHIGDTPNPYEQAISIIGRTLSKFDEDNLIPCFGFGDASTHDKKVFRFYQDDNFCNGFEEVLKRYREIIPHLRLAGPTSFSAIIETATTVVEESGGQYHVLLIIADGQVTRSVNTKSGELSPQEQNTINAIVQASEYPLSIIVVGVGDGPWDTMKEFDDNIPSRAFDNFQFVNFTEIMSKNLPPSKKETEFALAALMEIPSQYKATLELHMLGCRRGDAPGNTPLPPPVKHSTSSRGLKRSRSHNFSENASPCQTSTPSTRSTPSDSDAWANQECPICTDHRKDLAFDCGHQTCRECGQDLVRCPMCRHTIQTRIKLY